MGGRESNIVIVSQFRPNSVALSILVYNGIDPKGEPKILQSKQCFRLIFSIYASQLLISRRINLVLTQKNSFKVTSLEIFFVQTM